MNKSDRQHLSRLVELGCIACRNAGIPDSPAEVHHIRAGQGMSQRARHDQAIPLCPRHHRLGGHGVAIHAGQKTWESIHGSELELLHQVRTMMGVTA